MVRRTSAKSVARGSLAKWAIKKGYTTNDEVIAVKPVPIALDENVREPSCAVSEAGDEQPTVDHTHTASVTDDDTAQSEAAAAPSESTSSSSGCIAVGPTSTSMSSVCPPPAISAEVTFPVADPDVPKCSRCRTPLTSCRVQITGKKSGVWKCGTCCTRATQLHRIYQTTKPDGLDDLTPDEQAEFWKKLAASDGTAASIKKIVDETVVVRKTELTRAREDGQYRPLGYYEKLGYDTKRIEELCEFKKFDKVAGWTYKVVVEGDTKDTVDERVRQKVYGGKKRDRSPSEPRPARDTKHKTGKGNAAGKAKAKASKKKDSAKDRAAKDSAKQIAANKKLASKIITKVAAVHLELQELCKNKYVSDIPSFAKDSLEKTRVAISEIDKSARASCKTGAVMSFEMSDVDKHAADAKQHIALVKQWFSTYEVMIKREAVE